MVFLVAERTGRATGGGLLAAVVYAALYYSFGYWNTAQTDGWLNLPAALAVLAFVDARERERPGSDLLCGAAIGVAVLFKYPLGILLPLLGILTLVRAR